MCLRICARMTGLSGDAWDPSRQHVGQQPHGLRGPHAFEALALRTLGEGEGANEAGRTRPAPASPNLRAPM